MNDQIVTGIVRVAADQIIMGIISGIVSGIVVAVVSGVLFVVLVPRWLRKSGKVDCELLWEVARGAGSAGSPGREVQQRQLTVTFKNHKDVPVTVRSMKAVFYRGNKLLDEQEHPHVQFTRNGGRPGPFQLVSLPPFEPVTLRVTVYPGNDEPTRQRAVEEADRVEFVAEIEGYKTKRTGLALWNDETPPKTQRV